MNKIEKILVICAIAVLILPAVALEVPSENRDCYIWGTQLYMCFVSQDGSYAKWFTGYQEMHDYYTPQLREVNITGGETYPLTVQTRTIGSIMVTGSPSYLYVKNSDLK